MSIDRKSASVSNPEYGGVSSSTLKSSKNHRKNKSPHDLPDSIGNNRNKSKEVCDDDDDVIIIDEKGQKLENDHRKKRTKREDGPKELCVFHRQVVTEHDYRTLADSEYLNDAIINFYLTFLFEKLPRHLRGLVHIFSSHFYSRLKGGPKVKRKEKGEKHQTQAERCYSRVKSWTKKVDVFSKRMLIFPICEDEHWYLMIVCNPGLVLSQKRRKDFAQAREEQQKLENEGANPFLMILDSLSGTHSTASNKIRNYLQFEHLEKKKYPLTFGRDKMDEKYPSIPLQPNSCDCGVFLLHYVELIFQDPAKFLGANLPDLSEWFTEKEIDYKRHDIAITIRHLAAEEASAKSTPRVEFPHIKFPAKRPKAHRSTAGDAPQSQPPSWLPRGKRKSTGGRPHTPPYPPPPSDPESDDSSPSPPPPPLKKRSRAILPVEAEPLASKNAKELLSHLPKLLGGSAGNRRYCSVVTTRLDDVAGSASKRFFRSKGRSSRRRRQRSPNGEVIHSKSEMLKELMKGCQ